MWSQYVSVPAPAAVAADSSSPGNRGEKKMMKIDKWSTVKEWLVPWASNQIELGSRLASRPSYQLELDSFG